MLNNLRYIKMKEMATGESCALRKGGKGRKEKKRQTSSFYFCFSLS